MSVFRRPVTSFVACFIGLLFGGGATLAQEPGAANEAEGVLEEIVVTARKRSETLQDVPLSISVFGSQDIVDIGAKNLEDISTRTPGLQYVAQGGQEAGRLNTAIRFRGMDINSTLPTQQLATVFIDSIPVMGGLAGIGVQDLARIEVIKGPQSAFFGRSTFGGAINFITKDPGNEFSGRLSVEAASHGQTDILLSHEGPIVPDKLLYRVTGRTYHTDGPFRSQADQGKLGEQDTDAIQATLLATPTDNFTAKVRVMAYEDEDSPPAGGFIGDELRNCFSQNGGPLFNPSPDYTGIGPVDYFCGEIPMVPDNRIGSNTVHGARGQELFFAQADPLFSDVFHKAPSLDHMGLRRQAVRASLAMDYTFPRLGWVLTSLTGYNDEEVHNVDDFDGEVQPEFFGAQASSFEDFFQELRLASDGGRLSWMVGLSYYEQEFISDSVAWLPAIDLFVGLNNPMKDVKTPAVFGSLNYMLMDQIQLSLEGRYQEDEIDQGLAANGVQMKETFTNFMPRVILQYQPVDDTNIYLTYAQGNKPGDFNANVIILNDDERQQVVDQTGGGNFVPEEELENFELGWKQRLLGGRANLNFAAYFMQWKNQQTRVPVFIFNPAHPNANPVTGERPIEILVAAGKTDLWGVEADGNLLVNDNLKLGMTFGWADSEYQEFTCGFVERFTGSRDCAGNQSPRFPEFSGSAYAQYTRPLADNWTGFIRGEALYVGETFVDESNLAWTKDYTTVQLRLGAETDALRLEFWANNLFDEDFYVAGARQTDFTNFFNFNEQGVTITPDIGRQVGITLIHNF